MSTIAFDQFALTRIADFARTLSRLHKTSRTRAVDDDQFDREFNAVCQSVWGYTTDDISDDLFSNADHAFLDTLDERKYDRPHSVRSGAGSVLWLSRGRPRPGGRRRRRAVRRRGRRSGGP